MFCERVQRSRSWPPRSQRSSHGARTVGLIRVRRAEVGFSGRRHDFRINFLNVLTQEMF
jgi:hypothetical protein